MRGSTVTDWVYCPRCDQDNMFPITQGELYECPICGVCVRMFYNGQELIGAKVDGEIDQAMALRFRETLRTKLAQWADEKTKSVDEVCLRIRIAYWCMKMVGKPFSVRPAYLYDKKQEGKSEQS